VNSIGVADLARFFKTDRDTVKRWAYHFKDYLSESANPAKGVPRQFAPEDVPVLGYIMYHWEDQPDFESISRGLNCGEHLEEPFYELATYLTPIFQEPPQELDESWRHGALIGGIVTGSMTAFEMANSYKRAGDLLTKSAIAGAEVPDLIHPILFNYRHAVELYLKAVLNPKKLDHDLAALFERLRHCLKVEFQTEIPDWFSRTILAFDEFDPVGVCFRYGEGVASRHTGDSGEFWIDLPHLGQLMERVAQGCNKIIDARGTRAAQDLLRGLQ
jgi:hypothetical protein